MTVWVLFASKYGSTREVAEAIAEELKSPTPSPPTQSSPAPLPAPEVASVESAPPVVRGSGGERADSGSHRDD